MTLPPMIDPNSVQHMEPDEYNMRVWADKQAIEVIDRQKSQVDALTAERDALILQRTDYSQTVSALASQAAALTLKLAGAEAEIAAYKRLSKEMQSCEIRLREELADAQALLTQFVEHMDSDIDGGDGLFEEAMERFAEQFRDFLAPPPSSEAGT